MNNSKKDIFQEINFNNITSSFEDALKSALDNFWEIDTEVKFYAINDFRDFKVEKVIEKTSFFSSQVKVQNHNPVVIRLSDKFVDSVLSKILSTDKQSFNIQLVTKLEMKILNSFCEFLYKKLDNVLKSTKEVKITEQSSKNINIVFLVSLDKNNCSKIMLSIPQDRINLEQIKKEISFKDENFLSCASNVRIRAGKSKISLDELKNLSADDIVLLEESNISKLTLISGEFEKDFNVKTDASLVLELDNEEEAEEKVENLKNDEVTMEKNLWDDIQIEINAEFEKVKMTIGELKQITQGQVVDLGSVFDNEISLLVENKVVAKGELLIVNDRYAVKLNKVLANKPNPISTPKEQSAPEVKTQQKPLPQAKTAPNKQTQAPQKPVQSVKSVAIEDSEDFDYSDFEK